jgi:uncharacterized metal-binding protein
MRNQPKRRVLLTGRESVTNAPCLAEAAGRPLLPLVYSCSGCSSAAQMANRIALWMDADGAAEMSCIAGVGGGVPGLLRTAQSGRPVFALDGCILHCTRACLARAGVEPTLHLTLSDFGVRKRKHEEFDSEQAGSVYREQVLPAVRQALGNA